MHTGDDDQQINYRWPYCNGCLIGSNLKSDKLKQFQLLQATKFYISVLIACFSSYLKHAKQLGRVS